MFKPERILVPTDFSEHDESCSILAVKQAAAIAAQNRSALTLLHVITEDLYRKQLFFLDDEKIEELKDKIVEHARKELERIARQYVAPTGVTASLKVREGVAYDEILKEERESAIDLIAISSRGQSKLLEFFYGSTTERVVRRATCSVLVVRKIIDR